ncbi:hypothetical protein V8C42DRAFT_326208 [Trichoderma barbatum]
MPAHHQKPAPLAPASPRNTAKYTNKDGSKFITVPKASPSDSSRPSTPTVAKSNSAPPPADSTGLDTSAPTVNRKKQKRRQKAAAKAAAAQAANGHPSPALSSDKPMPVDYELVASDEDEDDPYDLVDDAEPRSTANGHTIDPKANKKNKKKKKKNGADYHAEEMESEQHHHSNHHHHHHRYHGDVSAPAPPAPRGSGMSRDKIWSTSNHEERERIKEFWLGLGEDDRKSLVKVEKDAVLKKMKEQQKHTCSCTVCGRKRTAIEEELEGLYDAYYLELEQFANQGEGPPMLPPPPRDFSIRPTRGLPGGYPHPPPARGRIVEHVGDDDEELEEAYSEDEAEDDEYSDDEPPEEFHGSPDRDVADFLTFGNSLQVKGGILTVADDLLKNDGRRFIEMMEQLAERRMAREEDAREHFARGYGHPNGSYSTPHNHPPPEDEDYEDEEEEEEEDYDDSQDEEYEDEEDPMTEEQRMEEGRRMFQIFAARMFEQRVLSAYKEKVAKERQEKLLEELEEESRAVDEQKAKRAKNAQKKKDKAAQRKQALADEKARKEADKAAEETARIEAEKKKIAEQKQKAEEKRKQKEAQKKAEEDARLKKEADRLRRIHELKEKQAEAERKAREAKEREKKLKDEQRTKEREAREQKEREAQERKDKQERDKREKEARAAAKAQRESQEAAEAAREQQLQQQRAKEEKATPKVSSAQVTQTQSSQPAKRGIQQQQQQLPQQQQPPQPQPQQPPVSLPAVLPQHPPNPASFISPKIPVATPAIPKAPTPIRPRTTSQQHGTGPASSSDSQTASVPSQSASPHSVTPVYTSPSSTGPERRISAGTPVTIQPTTMSGTPPGLLLPKGPSPSAPFQMPMMSMQPPPGLSPHPPPPPPGFSSRPSHDPIFPVGFRPSPGHSMMIPPPGINSSTVRGYPPVTMPPPGFSQPTGDFPITQGYPMPTRDGPVMTHGRQGSIGFDSSPGTPGQPIGRPAPIGRPGSISHGYSRDKEEDTQHLGSRVLVEDDEPLGADAGGLRHQPPGPRGGFAAGPFIDSGFPMGHNPWGPINSPPQPFPPATATAPFALPTFGNPGWGPPSGPPGFHVGSPSGLGSIRSHAQPRHVTVRLLLSQACKELTNTASADKEGYVDLGSIKAHVDMMSGDPTILEQDLLNLCDTVGSLSNGGGSFDVKQDVVGLKRIRWVPDADEGLNPHFRAVGAPGEIGSPLVGHASLRGI